jgi:hypothetical protein
MNLGLYGERLVTNHLSHGMAIKMGYNAAAWSDWSWVGWNGGKNAYK